MQIHQQRYIRRISEILEYIDSHLEQKLSLEELAARACCSAFYFHRVFHALVGETIHNYMLGRRLSGAANALLSDIHNSITEIAFKFGFSSSSDFSRAFKQFFRITPRKFRLAKQGHLLSITREDYIIRINNTVTSTPINRKIEEKIKIVKLENLHVAYIFCIGLLKNFFTPGVLHAFEKLRGWVTYAGLLQNETRFLGIYYDNPETIPLDKCRYDTCVTIAPGSILPAGISTKTLPLSGQYICYRYSRSNKNFAEELPEVIEYLIRCWFPANGFLPDNRPGVEIYSSGEQDDILVDLHIAIKPV